MELLNIRKINLTVRFTSISSSKDISIRSWDRLLNIDFDIFFLIADECSKYEL